MKPKPNAHALLDKSELTPYRQLGLRSTVHQEAIINAALPFTGYRCRNTYVLFVLLKHARELLAQNKISEDTVLAEAGFIQPKTGSAKKVTSARKNP